MRLNLGSGADRIAGWLNVDVFWANAPDLVADGMNLPFVNGGFNIAYVGHVLEYVEPEWTVPLMAEVRRVLRPGGHLAVVSPDIRRVMKLVRDRRMEPETFHEAVYGTSPFPFDRQLWLPDTQSIVSVLKAAGFIEVEPVSRRLARGWPQYEPRAWESTVRAVNPQPGPIGHDGARPGRTEEDPMAVEQKSEALTKATEAGLNVTHRISGGQYLATVRDGDAKAGSGRGDTLDEAIAAAQGNLGKVDEDATSTDLESEAKDADEATSGRRTRSGSAS